MGVGSSGYLYKPAGENSGRGLAILPANLTNRVNAVHIVDADGNELDSGRFRHPYENGGGIWDFSKSGGSYGTGTQVRVTLDDGSTVYYGGGQGRYDGGPVDSGNTGASGSGGAGGFMPGGAQGGGSVGASALPFWLPYPQFPTVDFPEIDKANYNFTDPTEFAKKFGDVNRGEVQKNFAQSKDMALDTLDTELKALEGYAPAAAALARSQASADNTFNQSQRTSQLNTVLPRANELYKRLDTTLRNQADRAESYARGEIPDANLDSARELNIRSRAADASGFSGIGPNSMAAAKTSDLMSADSRLQLSQYGESLIGQNTGQQEQLLGQEAELKLAPTEYINAGQQIKVTPPVSASQLTYEGLSAINSSTLLSPGAAFQGEIQQNQYDTSLAQRTAEFNATGKFSAATFNSGGIFQSLVGQFNTDMGYLNGVQAANQHNLDFASALELQGIQQDGYNAGTSTGQAAQQIQAVGSAIGATTGAVGGITDILGNTSSASGGTVGQASSNITPETNNTDSLEADKGDYKVSDYNPTQGLITSSPAATDATTPYTVKMAADATPPQGYTSVAKNMDGSVSAASNQGYAADLERFARNSGANLGDLSVADAARVDRSIATTAGLSFVPLQGFQPIATLGSGQRVYASSNLTGSTDSSLGKEKVVAAMQAAMQLGVGDPSAYQGYATTAVAAGSSQVHDILDQAYAEDGEQGVATLIHRILTPEGTAQSKKAALAIAFGSQRIGELWPSMSPAQRALAISALAPQAAEAHSGKDISKEQIPGTSRSIAGPLKVGDAVDVTARGQNGFALARNWNQLSVLGAMVNKKDPQSIAKIAELTGFLGYGPQGAAVPVKDGYLRTVGAKPFPEAGVGAAVFEKANHIPSTYKAVGKTEDGRTVAIPANLVSTSIYSGKEPTLSAYKKASLISADKHPAQKVWGKAPSRGVMRGAAGGSAIVAALNTAMQANPDLAGAMVAHSLFNNTMGNEMDNTG